MFSTDPSKRTPRPTAGWSRKLLNEPSGFGNISVRGFVRACSHQVQSSLSGAPDNIGAYNFGAQYQQAPFEYLAPDEMRGGCFSSGDDELGFPTHLLGRVCERAIMAYELFGVGDRHPATRPRALSPEEFEQLAPRVAEYQRKLKEDT